MNNSVGRLWARVAASTLVCVGTLQLTACGGDSTLPPERPAGTVRGYAVDGVIVGGNVRVYAFTSSGPGDVLGEAITDEQGQFTLSLRAASQPVLLEVQGGTYVEDADNLRVTLRDGAGLRAVALYESGANVTVQITPLTHVAAALAQFRAAAGEIREDAVTSSNREISQLFGVAVADTAPRSIRAGASGQIIDDATRYGFLLAALSSYTKWLSENNGRGHDALPTYEFAQLMAQDVAADGVLDGKGAVQGDGAALTLAVGDVALNQEEYRSAFAQHVLVVANAPYNKTGFKQSDVESIAAGVLGAASPVLAVDAPLQLDLDALEVRFLGNEAAFYSGVIEFDIRALDRSGLDHIVFDIDGEEIGNVIDPALPRLVIDTRRLSDGAHTVTARVRDSVGNERRATFTLLVDNSAPVVTITSRAITNAAEFELTGTHEAAGAPVRRVWVGGREAQLASPHEWSARVALVSGANTIPITVVDAAGNQYSTSTIVKLDIVPPAFRNQTYKSNVAYALGGGLCYVAGLQDASDTGPPLYFNRDRLTIGRSSYSWLDLDRQGISYFRFAVEDPSVAGVYTPADEVSVRVAYERDGQVMMASQPLPPVFAGASANPYYLVPLAADFLPAAWPSSAPTSAHRIRVEIADAAGNRALPLELRFRAEFGTGDCVIR